jgi:hypothetical protein
MKCPQMNMYQKLGLPAYRTILRGAGNFQGLEEVGHWGWILRCILFLDFLALCVSLSLCMCVYFSLCISVYAFLCVCLYMGISFCVSLCVSVSLYVCFSLSLCMTVCVCVSLCVSVLSVFVYLCVCLCLCVCLFLSVYLSLSLSLSPPPPILAAIRQTSFHYTLPQPWYSAQPQHQKYGPKWPCTETSETVS